MSMGGRRSRAVPAFAGTNLIHSNPLPPVSSLPSFSYGSPQAAYPRQISARDAKVTLTDALEHADAAAKARLEAAAHERKLAEEEENDERERRGEQVSVEPTTAVATAATTRKRSLRSQSVLSQDDDTFHEGDETSLEIHRIIAGARNPTVPESSMLRARSVNAGTKEPRSAMKGSRQEALRPSAKTRARHTASARTTVPLTPIPVDGEKDATFDEENQAIGLVPRVASSSLASPSLTPQPLDREREFRDRQVTSPDTFDYAADDASANAPIPSNLPATSPLDSDNVTKPSTPLTQQTSSARSWFFPLSLAKSGFRSAGVGIKKTAVILGIFVKNLFGPLLNYLLLGFFIFGITTLTYSFLQRSSSYYPPLLPPASSEDVFRRLMEAEKQLGALSRAYDKGSKQWDSLSKMEKVSRNNMEQQVASVQSLLSAYSSLSAALEKHTNSYQTDQRQSISTISTLNAQIEQLDKSIKKNDAVIKDYNVDPQSLRDQLSKMQGQIKNVDANLQRLKQSQELGEKALRSIEAMLPKQIAARLDPQTGRIVVAPELLRYLQTVLRKDIQEEIVRIGPSAGEAAPGGQASAVYSWDEFLKTNAGKLRGYLGQMSEERWREAIADGVVVSREDMVQMIRNEFESVRNIAERDNKELVQQLMLEAEGVAKKVVSTAATSISSAALAAASNYVRHFKGGSGSANQYGDALIQAALHQYSAIILQKPDYALLARGTLVDPRLTSSTFDPYGNPGILGKFSTFLRPGPNEPAHVLTESTNIGDCWSFPQSSGQVSILLAENIFPTDITIDHVPRGISGDDTSAPREVEFWVRIDDDLLRGQVGKAASVAIGDVPDSPSTRHYLAHRYVRVASFVYDVNSQYPVQTFELPVDLQKLGVPVTGVSFKILSNWGNEEYTSIYRVRVHGNPVNRRSGGDSTEGSHQPIRGL
ncbi:hypothetical protein ABW20_dc0101215 [Dactylellina cionopaga]|nr:hypothetical protein ABW20_dc0101215 [Dactylellina cionopaga]